MSTHANADRQEENRGFWSKLFGRNRQPAQQQQVAQGSNTANSQLAGQADESIIDNFDRFNISDTDELFDIAERLGTSSKGGFGKNSDSFNKVMSALKEANRFMHGRFTNDKAANMMIYQDNLANIQDIITACNEYIDSHKDPFTSSGKARKSMVQQIRSMAQTDEIKLSNNVMNFYALSAEEQQNTSMPELLRNARTIQLHTDDVVKLRGSKASGGNASDVIKLNVNGDNVTGAGDGKAATHYFKFEDEIDTRETDFNGDLMGSGVIDKILEHYPEIKGTKDEKIIRNYYQNNLASIKDEKVLPLKSLTDVGKSVIIEINNLMPGVKTTYEALLQELGLAGGETERKVNMTRRNVATSRVAEILGLGNLVAKSEMVEITDNNNNTFRGNMMQSAIKGKSGKEIGAEQKKGEKMDALAKASAGSGYQIKIAASGGFQRDLCNLQILDCICGQVDRHAGNFIVSQNEDGEMTGVQGIDNDGAFGLNDDNSIISNKDSHKRSVVNRETGTMTLPYIDDETAKRIESLDGSILEYLLKDLLKDDEIKACIARFEMVKNAIKKTRSEEPNRFLTNENEWNDDTAQKMVDQSWALVGKNAELEQQRTKHGSFDVINKTTNYESYFGRFMSQSLVQGFRWDYGQGASPKIKRHK